MKTPAILVLALMTSGCISTSEMPLAPNVYRIETNASGLLFTGQAGNETLKRAAQLTIEHGYTRFKFADADYSTGYVVSGLSPTKTNANINANYYPGGMSAYGTSTTYGPQVERVAVSRSTATVVMFRDGEPGSENSFDAAEILAKAQ